MENLVEILSHTFPDQMASGGPPSAASESVQHWPSGSPPGLALSEPPQATGRSDPQLDLELEVPGHAQQWYIGSPRPIGGSASGTTLQSAAMAGGKEKAVICSASCPAIGGSPSAAPLPQPPGSPLGVSKQEWESVISASDISTDAGYVFVAPHPGNTSSAWQTQLDGAYQGGIEIVSSMHDTSCRRGCKHEKKGAGWCRKQDCQYCHDPAHIGQGHSHRALCRNARTASVEGTAWPPMTADDAPTSQQPTPVENGSPGRPGAAPPSHTSPAIDGSSPAFPMPEAPCSTLGPSAGEKSSAGSNPPQPVTAAGLNKGWVMEGLVPAQRWLPKEDGDHSSPGG